MPLSDILTVQITANAALPTQQGFGVPLILGAVQNATFSADLIRYYASLAAMTTDGFLTTDPEYIFAAAMFSQNPSPPLIAVGRRTNKPTQQFKVTVLQAVNGKTYTVFINGVAKSFTAGGGDTTSSIATALATAIGTPGGFGAAAAVGAVITMTASAPGNWLRVSVSGPNSDLDLWQSHANNAVQTDLNNIFAVDSTWYAIVSTFAGTLNGTAGEVAQIAAWAESNQRLYIADMQDTTILASSTSDMASTLKTQNYARTAPFYSVDNGNALGAGIAAKCLPLAPGSETWKFKTLNGVAVGVYTATQQTNLTSKRANYYYSIASIGITTEGSVSDAEFIDTIRGRDWLVARLQTRILTVLANAKKVPYTDSGIAIIESEVRAQLVEGISQGYLAASPAPTVSVPKMSAVSGADRTARVLNNVSFTAQLAGAIHKLGPINGTVTA
jgi:hypothetical protein